MSNNETDQLNIRYCFHILLYLCLSFGSTVSIAQGVGPSRTPNLIIIFADDLGYGDLGSYGHPTIRTPRLDQMATEGMRFTQFYVAASVCTPSRAGLLTGRYPVRTGLVEGIIPGRVLFPNDKTGLRPEEVTIAEVLREQGYATMAIGKWHLGHLPAYLPTAQGFDGYFGIPYSNDMDYVALKEGKPGYWNVPLLRDTTIVERPAVQETLTKRYTEEAIRFVRSHRDQPFFLYLAHTMPHIPLFASDDFEGTSRRGLYGDVVEEIDWGVGEILSELRTQGLDDSTLVVFTSDNGPWLVQGENGGSAGLLKDGKGTTWEGGMREPMIAWWPGHVPANQVSDALASTLDILPTAAALSGAELPERELDGYDILPLLLGGGQSPRDFLVYYRGNRPFAARLGPWKAHFRTQTAYPDGPIIEHDPPQLYQLERDPSERFDVASEYPEIVAEIEALLDEHVSRVGRAHLPTIEAEDLLEGSTVTGGSLRVQDMRPFSGEWGGDEQLWWVDARPGDRLSISLDIDEEGPREIVGFFTRARDYGIVRLWVNGSSLGDLVDGYGDHVVPTGPVSFGWALLKKGTNQIDIELIGKDVRAAGYSDGFLVGIDGFALRR